MTPSRAVILIIAVSAAARIVLAGSVGLGVDESYMASVSRELALSYFDHPPLHVWIAAAARIITGSESDLVLRLPFIGLFALTTWLMYRLTALAFGERAGLWAVVALNLAPVFTLSTASWLLPDSPLMCCALAGAWPVARLMLGKPEPHHPLVSWLGAGVAGGLALLSKYLGIFLFAGIGLFLVTSRPHRRMLATPGPWLGAVVAALVFTPVIVWNMQHDWISFAFQGGRGLPEGFSLNGLVQGIGGQIAYLMPAVALALIYVLARALIRGPTNSATWFFACLAIGPIALFAVISLWTRVLPHWPMIGWLFVFPLLGDWLTRVASTYPRLLQGLTALTAAVLVAFVGIAASQATTGWLDRWVPALATKDPTADLLDWRDIKSVLTARGALRPGGVVAAVSWIDAGKISYALGGGVTVLCLCSDPHEFGLMHDPRTFVGRDIIVVANAARSSWLETARPWFAAVEPLDDVVLSRAGSPAVVLRVARGIRLTPQN